jgi:hypothetical protein
MADARLKGQEVEIRITRDAGVQSSISAIGTFNDSVMLETKQDGFLGELADRFDDVMRGYSFDLEFQISEAAWVDFQRSMIDRSQRKTPDVVFNVIRTDFYTNGDTLIMTYLDVKFGAQPTTIASRGDFVKVKLEGKCSERSDQKNSFL